jgi:RNA polymerase sigma-70 factor (ECF subfamily)
MYDMKLLMLGRTKQTQMSSKNKQQAVDELSENELLTRYRNGDEDAFYEVVNRHKKLLYTFLRRFVDDLKVVEYIFLETFLQLYTGQESFGADHALRPWLITVAANKAKDVLQKNTLSIYQEHGTIAETNFVRTAEGRG